MKSVKIVCDVGITFLVPDFYKDNDELFGAYKEYWHREGGLPAFVGKDGYSFHVLDKHHRYNGPATVHQEINSGWAISGKFIDGTEYFNFLDDNSMNINALTDDDKILIQLYAIANEI